MTHVHKPVSRMVPLCMLAAAMALAWPGEALNAQDAPMQPGLPEGTFPLIAFSAGNPTDKNFAEVKQLGFSCVHRYRLGSHPDASRVKMYMDSAARHGLKVMLDMSGFVDPRHSPAKDMTVEERLQALREGVRRWKEHPALGLWYIYDEPSPAVIAPADLRAIHDTVKAETPTIPTAIAQHWGKKWWEYMTCADIIMPDFYPIRMEPFPELTKLPLMPEFFGKVASISERAVPIVQCFGFPRLPNQTETRYMLFSSLTQGIEGMAFWSYWYARYKPFQIRDKDGNAKPGEFDPRYMHTIYSPVLLELRAFTAAVMPTTAVQYAEGAADWLIPEADMIHGIWRRKGTLHILAVNNSAQERNIDIPFGCEISNCSLAPFGQTRKIQAEIRDGRLILPAAKPWEVFLWRTGEGVFQPPLLESRAR